MSDQSHDQDYPDQEQNALSKVQQLHISRNRLYHRRVSSNDLVTGFSCHHQSPVTLSAGLRLRIAGLGPALRLRRSTTHGISTTLPPAASIFERALLLNLWASTVSFTFSSPSPRILSGRFLLIAPETIRSSSATSWPSGRSLRSAKLST